MVDTFDMTGAPKNSGVALADMAVLDNLAGSFEAIVEISARLTGAERASVFLHDEDTGELYTLVALGLDVKEIRLKPGRGIAGAVFTSGESAIVNDVSEDPRHMTDIDEALHYHTRSLICVPLRAQSGEVIGVAQCVNKAGGDFTEADRALLEEMSGFFASTLRSIKQIESLDELRQRETDFMELISQITSEIDLTSLLDKVIVEICRMLDSERATLFLNDSKTAELFSIVGKGLEIKEIRLPNSVGISGAVFTTGDTISIPHAYADLRFNPSFDRDTGFFTRSILCVPVINKDGVVIGVTQALNKRGGPFNDYDAQRLRAFSAQISIGLENAKLFRDVQAMRNYNESILHSMANIVLAVGSDGIVKSANTACQRILGIDPKSLEGRALEEIVGSSSVLLDSASRAHERSDVDELFDVELTLDSHTINANVTTMPLNSDDGSEAGLVAMIEDISTEKRIRSTMARYLDPNIADRVLSGENRDSLLGGTETLATVLFSDIRGFTSISEELGASGTVALLNSYFEKMVECISREGGMLDKFIGDAIMAAFGVPEQRPDDEDRALRASIDMIRALDAWNLDRAGQGQRAVGMGIGLNSEPVVAGNIGTTKRMDYTIIGDGVNLAARLESACKYYGATILLSDFTRQRLKGAYRMRELDLVVVKGKQKPVQVWEALDYHSKESFPGMMDVIGHFSEGVSHYRGQDWDQAIGQFERVLKARPDDKPSKLYLDRCSVLKADPPPADWDGVFVMTDK